MDILDSLKAMPALERLILAGSLPDIPQPIQGFIEQQPVIPLLRLKDLRLRCFNETCWALWALLDIDTAAHVSIHSDLPYSLEFVTMAFSRHLNRPGFLGYKALKMWQNDHTSLSITLSNTDDLGAEPLASTGICVQMRSGITSDLSLHILRVIPLHNLEIFNVRGICYTWCYEDIAPLFAKALRLRFLSLRGAPASWAFCSLLFPESTFDEPVNEATLTDLPLPSLKELHVECVNLRASRLSAGYGAYQSQLSLGDQLICALRLREVSQGRIHCLSVKRSEVALDWVPKWSSLVTNVDWDGEEVGDHQMEERELTRRVRSGWGSVAVSDDWGSPVLGDQDEIDFLGEDAQSTGSFGWEAEDSSEEDEEEEEEIEEVWT
ncbi:hypothetical protein PENSPDRAFT_656582 [Peniophora sp. CONT]|nr:hypothetical protein PENSPDRAFT_656582 [Peniophora sp. CONT]